MRNRFVLIAFILLPATAGAQLPGQTAESSRPLVEEGQPRRADTMPLAPPPPSKKWIFGSGGSFAENSTVLSSSATLSMTGVTGFELNGAYTRRDPDGAEGIDGVGGYVKLFLPETWTTRRATVAATAQGRWDFDDATVWAVLGAMDVRISDYVLVGGSLGYNERQPDEGVATSGFVPALAVTAFPVTGTEVRLQYRLDNDFDREDRTELSVSNRFGIGGSSSLALRLSVAKHGTISTSILIYP